MIAKAMPGITHVLVITNDSTVFLKKGIASAFEMFGGRMTEVKKLVARLDLAKTDGGEKLCEVSFGIISARFGYLPADYTVMPYEETAETPEDFSELEERKQFLEMIERTSKLFDRIVVCVPKAAMRMIIDYGALPNGKVIAVTNPEFIDDCQNLDWLYLERKGARVGKENCERIMEEIRAISQ